MQTNDQVKPARKKSFKKRILHWLLLTSQPTIKVYNGYVHNNNFTVFGHVFKLSPYPRKRYRKSFIVNTLALLRLFMVKPFAGIDVNIDWNGILHTTKTDNDGFFKFEWHDEAPIGKGWLPIKAKVVQQNSVLAMGSGRLFSPGATQYLIISDIDDTFLISHSGSLRKRLYVLFTENARSRRPFDGVVRHYQLLQKAGANAQLPNPFFYVSSSEWNLYTYITEFTALNKIPDGIFLLSQLKQFSELLKTGQNHHGTKFTRIVRILEAFPTHKVVLLGDSSQQDPYIYQSIVKHFSEQVQAVYIRDVFERNYEKVREVVNQIELSGVPCLLFKHSEDAILHSVKIGLIAAGAAEEKLSQPKEPANEMA